MKFSRIWRSIAFVGLTVIFLGLITAYQYKFTHDLLESELEQLAGSELTLKSSLVKSTVSMAEETLNHYEWDVRQNLNHPDSITSFLTRMGRLNKPFRGGLIAFVPGYFTKTDSLCEIYARNDSNEVSTSQIASKIHDYTKRQFYIEALAQNEGVWVDPYLDEEGAGEMVTTYAKPVVDKQGTTVGVLALDISIDWLNDTINARHAYPSSCIILLTEEGVPFISDEFDEDTRQSFLYASKLMNDTLNVPRYKTKNGRVQMLRMSENGRKGTVLWRNTWGEPKWKIALVCYDDEVYADLFKLRNRLSLLMGLGFLLMVGIVWRNIRSLSRLHDADMERERISGELHVANTIQMEMIPKVFPPYPERHDIDIFGAVKPAREVGGDLFDFFIRDEKLFFCIGDVSGKGVPSSLVMAVIHAQFRLAFNQYSNPARIMAVLNEESCEGNDSNLFVTLFIGVLDLPTGRLRYCNAGHDAPYIKTGGKWQQLNVVANLPIALFHDFKYTMQETVLTRETTLFLYTDGLTEGKNGRNDMLGLKRVEQYLEKSQTHTPKVLIEDMTEHFNKFSDGAEQSDDLTMLAITYKPLVCQETLNEKIVLSNKVSEVKRLNDFIKTVATQAGFEPSTVAGIKLAVEEAVVNVIQYAYPKNTEGEVTVEAFSNGQRMKIVLSDNGTPFDPTEALRADTTLDVEDRPVGGLGILLVRELMDTINYERTEGRNVLTLRKNINK